MFFKNGQVENSSNNFVNYGENTGIYEEIVGTVTAAFRDLVGNKYYAFAGNQHYILNHENKTVISTETPRSCFVAPPLRPVASLFYLRPETPHG